MKKILIVNNNLDMGGIQKSLVNLLKAIHDKYEVTLLLFSRSGSLLKDVPEGVKIITPQRQYRMLGLTKNELKKYPFLFLLKAFLVKYTELFSRRSAMKIMGLFQRKISGYDVVISYSHLFNHKYFGNGCGEFVLDKTIAKNKLCLVHCDYLNSGCMTEKNNAAYLEFDKIACCSDSVRERFLQGAGVHSSKVETLRNFYDLEIGLLANENPYLYDEGFINMVSIARLSAEKGISRAIEALNCAQREDVRYYIVGDGPQRTMLKNLVEKYHMEDKVFLLGEEKNPYQYMINADYLLVPSLHEAAPMVFDEAKVLGLPIITTNTTSAEEMVSDAGAMVCDNSVDGICNSILKAEKKVLGLPRCVDNCYQYSQFSKILNL